MTSAKSNKEIGEYLANLIDSKYKSRRKFCAEWLKLEKLDVEEHINNKANKLKDILNGKKSIQARDLPYVGELLGVTFEQIMSAGECSVYNTERVTNYTIANSHDEAEWQRYIDMDEKLVLNTDEYNKTVLDYAIEFGNYDFIKFLITNEIITYDEKRYKKTPQTYGLSTKICALNRVYVDRPQPVWRFEKLDEFRKNVIVLAIRNNDVEMLDYLHARELPELYLLNSYGGFERIYFEKPDFNLIKKIAKSSEKVIDYFVTPFDITINKKQYEFIYPFMSELLSEMCKVNSPHLEFALKKIIKHNEKVFNNLKDIVLQLRLMFKANVQEENLPYVLNWYDICKKSLKIHNSILCMDYTNYSNDTIITDIAKCDISSKKPYAALLSEELNTLYNQIINILDVVKEM